MVTDSTCVLEEKILELERKLANINAKFNFLKRIINEVPANIYISDLKNGVTWCNKTNEESLGFSLAEILEIGGIEYLKKIVHPDDLNIPDDSIAHYENFNGPEFGGIFRAKHKNEKDYKWFIGWAKAFTKNTDGQVEKVICVDVDMSPKMNTESQLIAALKENLKHKNKLLVQTLNKRELEILNLICSGLRTKNIAERLYLSVHTVNTHRKNIQHKLGTNNVADLVMLAKEAGLG